ncbi:MAG: DUF819 family protein [Eubacteriales bacterium]
MIITVIQILVIIGLPFLLTWAARSSKTLKFIGPILLAYIAGIVLANIPGTPWDKSLATTFSEIAVPIAIPLILMCTDLVKWFKLAKSTVLSFVMVIVAAASAALLSTYLFKDSLDMPWRLAGMLSGCYTGGTPNLVGIGSALKVPAETIVLVNTSDMLCGGVYFLLVTSVMKNVYRKFLPPFKMQNKNVELNDPFMQPVFSKGVKHGVGNIALVVGLSVLAAGASIGLALLLTGELNTVVIFLAVSAIGIGYSFWKRLHRVEGSWHIAEYFILLFSVALGGTVDVKLFFQSSPTILLFTASVMFSAIIIHFILCKIFKIDADTALITSTAGIYGPAFIGPVATALNNREVVVSGMVSGLAGYAVGNFLGVGLSYLIPMIVG